MNRRNARVLVVEDNEITRVMFRRQLHMAGVARIDEAEDGVAAAELLAMNHYDLVLADWQMPRMTGIELVRLMRGSPRLDTIPVVIVTGYFTRARILEAADAGVTSFLSKPVSAASLEEKLRLFLGPREHETHVSP